MAEQDVIAEPEASGGTVIKRSVARRPVLENGDRLTRCEFERRYLLRSDVKRAELIEGVVYMPSPVRFAGHGEPHAAMLGVLLHYGAFTAGVRVGDNVTVRLDLDNEPQPDVVVRIEPAAGGRSRVSDDDYVDGAPELVVEIAASSAAIDLHDKLNAYRRNGVPEYVVWRTEEGRIDWFVLADGEYRPVPLDDGGVIHSRIFPGLRVAAGALLNGDLARALTELDKGIASPEHDRFVARLARHA